MNNSLSSLLIKHFAWAFPVFLAMVAVFFGGLFNAGVLENGPLCLLGAGAIVGLAMIWGGCRSHCGATIAAFVSILALMAGASWAGSVGGDRTESELAHVTAEMRHRASVVKQALVLHDIISTPSEQAQTDIRVVNNVLVYSAEGRRDIVIGPLVVPEVVRRRGEIELRDIHIALNVLESRGMPPSAALHTTLSTAIASVR